MKPGLAAGLVGIAVIGIGWAYSFTSLHNRPEPAPVVVIEPVIIGTGEVSYHCGEVKSPPAAPEGFKPLLWSTSGPAPRCVICLTEEIITGLRTSCWPAAEGLYR